ncbi:MAG: peptidoglycan DD-metalloendopeptidase family protein [Candidatus Sungiibacteriota bacterium]|uniref:Peptidoglycan DD-metalloendopeptidase family protein n=1 Tax=Candidatus Sungiibacteriota bacterium TaxID=2750080 RepID=A0A7T5US47_9BACT|nr:MAG: peptidoglycan DD-metalloendopeptidase family protein [Candidatus Sungbacteria bacterium]
MGTRFWGKFWLMGAIGAIALFGFFNSGQASTVEELQKNIEQKNQEIKKLEEEAKKYRDEIVTQKRAQTTLKGELSRIENNIKKLRGDIVLTERKIQRAGLEIDTLKLEIREKEIAVNKLKQGLGGLIQIISESEQQSLLEILVRNSLLSDFFRQLDYAALTEKKILGSLDDLRVLQKELTIKKAQAEDKKDELENLQDSLQDRKKIQDSVKRDKDQLLKETKNQETRYQALLRETERKEEEILREMEELENELRKRVDPESLPQRRERFLLWPAEGLLSQEYGETPFTRGRGRDFYKFHNGIDISASVGTPILAADSGMVLAVGDTDRYCRRGAYGKYIVLDHKNNLATMYAHMSLIKVTTGQEVKRGDIIGYMGSTGLSTGPHLHFTLYDARTVEIRLGPKGTCGLLPFGGSINPLLYL